MISLQDILEVENDSAFLAFRCQSTGFLLWPLVRQELIQWVISDQIYKTASLVNLTPQIHNRKKVLMSLLKAELHNLFFSRKASDVVVMATGAGLVMKDGLAFNRLSDYFALLNHDQTVVIEDLFNWNWPSKRANENILYHTPMQAKHALLAKFYVKDKHLTQARNILIAFTDRLHQILGITVPPSTLKVIETRLAKKIAVLPTKKQAYQKIFKKINPRILLKEEGCYGHSSVVNVVAKEMGIVVAEYQHGTINAGHDAYNHGQELISDKAYQQTLPDLFLSYGEWWHQYLKLPLKNLAIGNPHRTERLVGTTPETKVKNEILVLGDGVETKMYLDLAHFLTKSIPEFKTVFRPHPLERTKLAELRKSGNYEGLIIDSRPDIYDSFKAAHVVVNEVSTGLFEAVGLVDRVLIWDTPKSRFYYPDHPFESFVNAEDLLSKIKQEHVGTIESSHVGAIWAADWQENYKNFIAQHLTQ